DEFARAGGPDPRDKPKPVIAVRDMFVPDLHIDTLKVKSRNFHYSVLRSWWLVQIGSRRAIDANSALQLHFLDQPQA
ncbi:hypothetical protein, partial [Rhizobium laguerreae]|uniref:hypothetical protein n=1 Tax=Rhizobium laguerreae TaxID=1076926 RepID=UPI001C920549